MSKQLTFPYRMSCMRFHKDGRPERVWYGQYETIEIVTENGWDVHRTRQMHNSMSDVTDVKTTDGIIISFDKPFYQIEMHGHG